MPTTYVTYMRYYFQGPREGLYTTYYCLLYYTYTHIVCSSENVIKPVEKLYIPINTPANIILEIRQLFVKDDTHTHRRAIVNCYLIIL